MAALVWRGSAQFCRVIFNLGTVNGRHL